MKIISDNISDNSSTRYIKTQKNLVLKILSSQELVLKVPKKKPPKHEELIFFENKWILLPYIYKVLKTEENEKREDVDLGLGGNLKLCPLDWQLIVLTTSPCHIQVYFENKASDVFFT